jgi:vitamin B12 transporter
MSKLILYLFLNFIFFNITFAIEDNNSNNCKWDNQISSPCVEINKTISNSSFFSQSAINKIVISKKQIEESGAVDLIDVLKFVPDINITQSGPKGQQASMFMRGTGSNHTLVMINGIPINDQSTTQGLHDFGVDFIQTIHQIEIYPGSGASLFGSNAIGGAINIILTGDYKDSFSMTTDRNTNYEFSGNKTYIYDNSSLNIKIGSVKNKTVSARGKSSDEKDGLKNYSSNINFERFLNKNLRIYNTTYLRQTKAEYDNSDLNQTGYKGDNIMGSFQFGLENKNKNKNDNLIFYYNFYDRKYDERGTIDTYESNAVGFKYDLKDIIDKKLSYAIGSEFKYDWGYFNNNGSYEASTKGHTDNYSLYGNTGLNLFKDTNVSLFLRGDNHKQTGFNKTYKVNLEQQINFLNLGFSYMNGLRNPTLYEMFGTDNYGYSGNKNLKPEKSNTYEIYSKWLLNKNVNLSLRAFKSNIKNNIEYLSNKYQNDSDDVDLNQSGINNQLNINFKDSEIRLFSSFLSSKKENNSNQLRRPKKNYGLNYFKNLKNNLLGDVTFNLKYNHYGKHFDTHSTSFSTIEMDSTDLIDLKITKKLKNSDFYIKLTNVLNESYQRPHGYNQEKRIIKLGMKY